MPDGAVMQQFSLLALGVLIGMQHALEADHLAAVAVLSARRSSRRALVIRGALWGTGHTIALFVVCGAVIMAGVALTERVEAALEFGVGAMIAFLALNVFWTMAKRRVHFHVHRHGDGRPHAHAHSHHGESRHAHDADHHRHAHPKGFLKSLFVGLAHGAAGSAALLVLVVAATRSPLVAMLYVACFGLGSVIGMAALSFIASFPLQALRRGAAWLNHAALGAIGCVAFYVGMDLMAGSWPALGF